MEKKRLEKYESLIHSIINEYFIVEGKGLIKNNFLTEKNSFVFESVEKGIIKGRYTIFGKNPDKIWEFNNKKAYKVISKMISYNRSTKSFSGNFEKGYFISKFENPNLKFLKKRFVREDIAAAAQKRIEEVIIKFIKDKENEYVDLSFTDPRGKLQHLTMDTTTVDDGMLNDGVFFDGSSIAGWKAINESDMILKPDLSRFFLDPFTSHNLSLIHI